MKLIDFLYGQSTTTENLLSSVSVWGSEASGPVARLDYSRQGSRAATTSVNTITKASIVK
jgi:hypothetical protein